MKNFLAMLCMLVLSACGEGQQVRTDLAGLRDMGDAFRVQLNIRDTAALAAMYAQDASILPPNAPIVSGRDAIEAFWTEFLASGNIVGVKDTDVQANGHIGYKVGTYTIASPHNQLLDRGKYIEVWHYTDGSWQLMYDIFNSDRPPADVE